MIRPEDFEKSLGSPFDPKNPLALKKILELDEREEFPWAANEQLLNLGFNQFLLPHEVGGKLRSYDQNIEVVKSIGRRDMTCLLSLGKNLLGSMPIFLFGSDEQKQQTVQFLRQQGYISLAITEHGNGSDVLSTSMQATPTGSGWKLNGEKWLINNIEACHQAVFLARTQDKGGPLGFSLFAVPLQPQPQGVEFGQKIRTLGVRGLRMNSVKLMDCAVDRKTLLGRQSDGFQQVMKTFQVSRAMAASLVLGGTETSLRLVTEFCLRRQLYGHAITHLEVVRERLAKSYIQYLVMEIVARFTARAITALPEELSVISSFAKAFIPFQAEAVIEDLAVTLGARSYLRETWYHGLFQKMRRDVSLVSLFDGSSQVNLYILANQLPQLLSAQALVPERWASFLSCWEKTPLSTSAVLFPQRLQLTNRGDLTLLSSLQELVSQAPKELQGFVDRCQKALAKFAIKSSAVIEFRSAERFCFLCAAICVLWNQCKGTPLSEASFAAAMTILLAEFEEGAWKFSCAPEVFSELQNKVQNDMNLGLEPYSVGAWYAAKKETDFA